jgi:hypothetical protein
MKALITVTVPVAKRIIAKAVAQRPDVKSALQNGRVLLKGGTTVSAISEEITGGTLRIGGRITPKGTRNALRKDGNPHCVLIESGKATGIDENIDDVVATLKRDDIIITSANAVDLDGNAAMMAAAPLGSKAGKAISGFATQGCKVIVAVGLEKFIPGRIRDAVLACGRECVDKAMGAAVGLIPVTGEVVTERDAVMQLADVNATVIASGGVFGAEGATTMIVEGAPGQVEAILDLVLSLSDAETSGTAESLVECEGGCPQCARHLACIYKLSPKKKEGDKRA